MGKAVKSIGNVVAAPFKAVNQVVKAVPVIGPAIDRGLVSLDKAVGSAIPGGWNTLAQTGIAFTPLGLPTKVGLAALGGSGAFGPKGKFNFQRALLSGALAYGANQLAEGLQRAGSTAYDPSAGLTDAATKTASNIDPGILEGMSAEQVARAAQTSPYFQAAQSNIDPGFLEGMSAANVVNANVLPITPSAPPAGFFQQTGANLAAAGQGIKNLTGFGTGTAAEAATKFMGPVTTGGVTSLGIGALGLSQLDEQEKLLNEQYQQGAVNDSEYQRQMALIADGRRRAEEAIRANPYQFAAGGSIDYDEQQGIPNLNYAVGGLAALNQGGQPRMLAGGGDGMSDSIPATIGENRPAKLSDGEFVIPADVVSNLGNGSSKAGAKRLYGMMDRVRKARTGTTKQAKAINPAKVMPA